MGGLIGWIVVGVAAGWLAGVITRTDRSIWGDLVLGLAGALIGGWITDVSISGGNDLIFSIIVAAVVAVVLVLLKNMIMSRNSASS